MPGPSNNPNINNTGTNSQGNSYTAYKPGGYYYRNPGDADAGKPSSTFYDTGKGHKFYNRDGPDGYSYHENANQGYRNYTPNSKK